MRRLRSAFQGSLAHRPGLLAIWVALCVCFGPAWYLALSHYPPTVPLLTPPGYPFPVGTEPAVPIAAFCLTSTISGLAALALRRRMGPWGTAAATTLLGATLLSWMWTAVLTVVSPPTALKPTWASVAGFFLLPVAGAWFWLLSFPVCILLGRLQIAVHDCLDRLGHEQPPTLDQPSSIEPAAQPPPRV